MTTDFQRQRGDGWRRTSNQWGSCEAANSTPSGGGGSSFLANPPAIPAPPPDPQDNLSRKASLPSKEPERKGSPVFSLSKNTSKVSSSKRESSISPPRTRTRARVQEQPDSAKDAAPDPPQENTYPPPGRRSRVRPPEPTPTISEPESTPSTTTLRTRSRSRANQEIPNSTSTAEATYPPPNRTRTRSRSRPTENNVPNETKEEEVTVTIPLKTRTRSRARAGNEGISNGPTPEAPSSPLLPSTRSRSRATENDLSSSSNSYSPSTVERSRSRTNETLPETSTTENSFPPPGRRTRTHEPQNVQNETVVENSLSSQRSTSPNEVGEETDQPAGSESPSTANDPPVRTRARIRSQESEKEDVKTEGSQSPGRKRTRNEQQESSQEERVCEQNSHRPKDTDTHTNDGEASRDKKNEEESAKTKEIKEYESAKANPDQNAEIHLHNSPIHGDELVKEEIVKQEASEANESSLAKKRLSPSPVLTRRRSSENFQKQEEEPIRQEASEANDSSLVRKSLSPSPVLTRRRSSENTQFQKSDSQVGEDEEPSSASVVVTLPPPGRRRSRSRQTEEEEPSKQEASEANDSSLVRKSLSPSPVLTRRRSTENAHLQKSDFQVGEDEEPSSASVVVALPPPGRRRSRSRQTEENMEPQNESISEEKPLSMDLPLNSDKPCEVVQITVEPSTPVDGSERMIGEVFSASREREKSASRESSPKRRFRNESEPRDRPDEAVSDVPTTPEAERRLCVRDKTQSREGSPVKRSRESESPPKRRFRNESEPRDRPDEAVSDVPTTPEAERRLRIRDKTQSREGSPVKRSRESSESRDRPAATTTSDSQENETLEPQKESVSREGSPRKGSWNSRERSPKLRDEEERRSRSPSIKGEADVTENEETETAGEVQINGHEAEEEDASILRSTSSVIKGRNVTTYLSDNLSDDFQAEEKEEEEEEDEDPLVKATRLWLLSKGENSEILDKVLPEIQTASMCKTATEVSEEPKSWWDDETDDQETKEEKSKVIEEWNEEFSEEPKNFTTFASIKLKSKPKDDSDAIPPPPPPPPPPPKKGIPAPPPPPPREKVSTKDKKVKTARNNMVEKIKRAARQRPDWKSVMKDIEFFYESEKPVVQSQLLGEIQRGVKLRHVKTNDRSKPDFNKLGLRKLRRQMTVEEKKALDSQAPELLPSSSDEEEDIDQMRDDLASTKAQLAEEIKKNKKVATEQKILKIDLHSLEAEVKKLKRKLKEAGIHEVKPLTNGEAEAIAPKLSKSMSKLRMMEEEMDFSELDTIEEDIKILNDQIEAQKKRAEKAEEKCDELVQKMQVSQNAADEWEMRSVYFEKKYKVLQKDQGIELPDIDCSGTQTDPVDIGTLKSESLSGINAKKSSSRKSFTSFSRMQSFKEEDESDDESSSSSEEDTLSDHGDDEDGNESDENEDDEIKGNCIEDMEKREEREFIMWKNRLTHAKDKVKNVRKERNNLREKVKKFYKNMRNERQEYLKLKAELKELLDQMKDPDEVVEEEDEEEEEEEEEIAPQDDEAPGWWCDEPPQKPKKLKKRKKKAKDNEDEDENIVDMSDLEDPQWTDSEEDDSESEEEDEDTSRRIKVLKEKTKKLEENMNVKKKDTYLLKSQIEQCEEMLGEEKRRHERLDNELHMLLSDI